MNIQDERGWGSWTVDKKEDRCLYYHRLGGEGVSADHVMKKRKGLLLSQGVRGRVHGIT